LLGVLFLLRGKQAPPLKSECQARDPLSIRDLFPVWPYRCGRPLPPFFFVGATRRQLVFKMTKFQRIFRFPTFPFFFPRKQKGAFINFLISPFVPSPFQIPFFSSLGVASLLFPLWSTPHRVPSVFRLFRSTSASGLCWVTAPSFSSVFLVVGFPLLGILEVC